ncbi:MAG TPA: AtpZ/AtpI family protein, partial [Acidimicrobiia bacterium]|nr:AtpZ/AtpI family protein [Acidimicrobiia bacterium]
HRRALPGGGRTLDPNVRRERPAPTWQQGFGDGLSQAVSLVVTPLLFALLGAVLDGWLGTRPLLTIVLAVLAVCGMFVSTYYQYRARMDAADEGQPWARNR